MVAVSPSLWNPTGQLLLQPSWFAPGAHLWVLAALGAVWGSWGRRRRNRRFTARAAVLAAVSSRLLHAAIQLCSQGSGGESGWRGLMPLPRNRTRPPGT